MGAHWYGLVLGVLATWRVTHLLQAEDGPADAIVRLRRALGEGLLGSLLDCFHCLSLWIAAPFAAILAPTWSERAMLWLALSGGACLLERARPSAPAAAYVEDEEVTDDLLRQEASAVAPGAQPTGSRAPSGAEGGSAPPSAPPDPGPAEPPGGGG